VGIENFDIMHAILDLVRGEYSMLPLLVLIVLECPDPQHNHLPLPHTEAG